MTPILIFYFLHHENFMVFFTLFTILILILVHESMQLKSKKNKFYRNLFISSMSCGTVFWIGDQAFCNYVQPYQLHAWWHFCTSLSIYSGLNILHA
jgi:CDP-diglyceride synthetase